MIDKVDNTLSIRLFVGMVLTASVVFALNFYIEARDSHRGVESALQRVYELDTIVRQLEAENDYLEHRTHNLIDTSRAIDHLKHELDILQDRIRDLEHDKQKNTQETKTN